MKHITSAVELSYLVDAQQFRFGLAELSSAVRSAGVEAAFCTYQTDTRFDFSKVVQGQPDTPIEVAVDALTHFPGGEIRRDLAVLVRSRRPGADDNFMHSTLPLASDLQHFPERHKQNPGLIEGVLSASLGGAALRLHRVRTGHSLNPHPLLSLADNASWTERQDAMQRANLRSASLLINPTTGVILSRRYFIQQLFT